MLLMMAALAMTVVSCDKNKIDDEEDEAKIPTPTYRVVKLMKSWEGDDKESGDMYVYNGTPTALLHRLTWHGQRTSIPAWYSHGPATP